MRVLVVLCSVFGIFSVVASDEQHHIEQRILENKVLNAPDNASLPVTTNSSEVLQPSASDPSVKLEQELNSLKTSLTSSIEAGTTVQLNNTLLKSENGQKFNVTSLLRSNSSTIQNVSADNSSVRIEAPNFFPTSLSVNGTRVIEGNQKKLQTLIQQQNSTIIDSSGNSSNVGLDGNNTSIQTEVKDLLNYTSINDPSFQQPLEPNEPIQIPDRINDDTELIENGENTEDDLRVHKNHPVNHEEQTTEFQQPYLAAILVSSLVAISVLCYAGLLTYRRYLENRYGSRTMLVNAEEFDDPNDLRHFTI